jgi:hypothetical protein
MTASRDKASLHIKMPNKIVERGEQNIVTVEQNMTKQGTRLSQRKNLDLNMK